MRFKRETLIGNLKLENIRFGRCVWPFTPAQTKALLVFFLVVAGLILLSHIIKIIDDGSRTTGKGAPDNPSTGNDFFLFLLSNPKAPECKKA